MNIVNRIIISRTKTNRGNCNGHDIERNMQPPHKTEHYHGNRNIGNNGHCRYFNIAKQNYKNNEHCYKYDPNRHNLRVEKAL